MIPVGKGGTLAGKNVSEMHQRIVRLCGRNRPSYNLKRNKNDINQNCIQPVSSLKYSIVPKKNYFSHALFRVILTIDVDLVH